MSNPYPAPFPIPSDGTEPEPPVVHDTDGDEILDEDIDADRIDSIEADRLAAGAPDEEDL